MAEVLKLLDEKTYNLARSGLQNMGKFGNLAVKLYLSLHITASSNDAAANTCTVTHKLKNKLLLFNVQNNS